MLYTEDLVEIGYVSKSHNLSGEVVLVTESHLLEKYEDEPVFLLLEGAPVPFFISEEGLSVRNHNSYIVKFDFVDSPEEAEELVGSKILMRINRDHLQTEEADVFLLRGFSVDDKNSPDRGVVSDVSDYSGNIVLEIDISGKKILLPFADEYIKNILTDEKRLVVEIPNELKELY